MSSSLNEFDSVWAPPNKAVDDRGATHDKVQDALDNADEFVFIGPGTFEEQVTISTAGLTVHGAGEGTLIDGTDGRPIEIDASNVTLGMVSAENDLAGGANNSNCVHVTNGSDNVVIRLVRVVESDGRGIRVVGENAVVTNCVVHNTDSDGINFVGSCRDGVCVANQVTNANDAIQISGRRVTVVGNVADDSGAHGIDVSDQSNVIVGNTISSPSSDGIRDQGTETVIVGNAMQSVGGTNINISSATDPLVFGNSPPAANDWGTLAGQNLQDDGSGNIEGTDGRTYRQRGDPSTSELAQGENMVFNSDGSGTGSAGDLVYAVNNGGTIETLILAQVSNAT